jgi:hypothetical protein
MTEGGGRAALPGPGRKAAALPREADRRALRPIQEWVDAQTEKAPPITDEQARVVQRVLAALTPARSIPAAPHPAGHAQANEPEREAG